MPPYFFELAFYSRNSRMDVPAVYIQRGIVILLAIGEYGLRGGD
jgi:hypothetical protein